MIALTNSPFATALVLGLGLMLAVGQTTRAQTTADTIQSATPTADSSLILDLAPYRDNIRRAALLVSQQPQVLGSVAQQQATSQQAFDSLIQAYGRKKQGWFYDIARFPDVLHELAVLSARANKSEGRAITQRLPPESQESAWRLYRHHHDDLVRADHINLAAEQTFDSLVTPLPKPMQTAFRQLMATPDVLTLLVEAIDRTTQLGQAYQADSAGVIQQLITMHDSLAAQNQRELADYQRELTDDPLAQQELQQAGQAYALANRYNTGINPDPAAIDSTYDSQRSYSFWSGYPAWLGVWYPSGWWYSTGFYYGSGGNLVLFRLPSPGFANWLFTRAYRIYPRLCNRFNNYYTRTIDAHRYWTRSNSGFMSAAHRTFGPRDYVSTGRNNWLTSPRRYSRSNSWSGSGTRVWSTGSTHRSFFSSTRSYHTSFRSRSAGHTRSFSSGHHSSSSHGSSHHSGGSHHSSVHR